MRECYFLKRALRKGYRDTPYYIPDHDSYFLASQSEFDVLSSFISFEETAKIQRHVKNVAYKLGYIDYFAMLSGIDVILYRDMYILFARTDTIIMDKEVSSFLGSTSKPNKLIASLTIALKEFEFKTMYKIEVS